MRHLFIPLVILGILFFALFRTVTSHSGNTQTKVAQTSSLSSSNSNTYQKASVAQLLSDEYRKRYIVDVINHGSTKLHFKKTEVMDAGFVSKEDAPKVACYVLSLSGKKCKAPYPSDAEMFYTSVCGGCHGNDGKGLNGTYPDLTREPLLGIKKRVLWLKSHNLD